MTLTSTLVQTSRRVLTGLVLAGCALAAQAALVVASDRSQLLNATTVDWSVLGPDLTALGSPVVAGPATVSGASAFTVFQQAPTGTWDGNFTDGESLLSLFDLNGNGPIGGAFDISFASAIAGFGTQAQDINFGAFSVTIDVYDATNSLLGSFNFNGDSNDDQDGSAVFVGVLSDQLDISRVVISGMSDGSAINQLTLAGPANPAPAPASLALVLMALLTLAAATSMRRRQG
jgi:hypothetical protein